MTHSSPPSVEAATSSSDEFSDEMLCVGAISDETNGEGSTLPEMNTAYDR